MREKYYSLKRLLGLSLNRLNLKAGKLLYITVCFVLISTMSFAQELNWTGTESNDANDPDNWAEQLAPWGNILNIDSAWKFTYQPVITVDQDRAIPFIKQTNWSKLEINVTEDGYLNINGSSTQSIYQNGVLTKTGAGTASIQRNLYLETVDDTVIVSDGILENRSSLLMGNKSLTTGGILFINGNGRFHCKPPNTDYFPTRFPYPNVDEGHIIITENGKFTTKFDFRVIADSLINITKQIHSTPDRDIVVKYDAEENLTTLYSRDKLAFLCEPVETQNLVANSDGTILRIIENEGLASMNSLVWKYSTTPDGTLENFPTDQSGDTLLPNFPNSGVYFVVCIGDNGTTTDTTNTVQFIVSSDLISVEPGGDQVYKVGQTPMTLTVTEGGTADSREWLVTQTPGEGYQSFVPPATGTDFVPFFDTAAEYYVICRSIINGVSEQSSEVKITINDTSTYGNLTWNGSVSESANNPLNWTPHAYMFRNNYSVDPVNYIYEPTYFDKGKDVFGGLVLSSDASFTISKEDEDTITYSGDLTLASTFTVTSGYISFSRLRLEKTIGECNVSGGGIICRTDFIIGSNNSPNGGDLNIYGTGTFDAGAQIWRWATDTTHSKLTIWDEGKLIVHSNNPDSTVALLKEAAAKAQLRSLEGWELIYNTNEIDGLAIVTAFDPNAISITPVADQILKVDETASILTAGNTEIYDTLEWKYTTSFDGEYVSFDPPLVDTNKISPSFSETGEYYVICVGKNETLVKKSNAVYILVPDVAVTPSEKQVVATDSKIELEVSETPEPDSRVWQRATVSGGPYSNPGSAIKITTYTETATAPITYYYVCQSTYSGTVITSNEVEVEIVTNSVDPFTNQTISVGQDGTTLSVTESGTSGGREWMYSTTSGSGYTAFSPAQTGETYTPNFDAAGVYYVVCSSDLSGLTVVSDEVRVSVEQGDGVFNTLANTLNVYPNPSTGSFFIDEQEMSNYRVEIYNSQGRLVLTEDFNNVTGPQEINIDGKGLYIVNLINNNQVKTNRLIVE